MKIQSYHTTSSSLSRTEYVENDVRRFLKAKCHVRIHETRLLCSQSMHDLPQSPECCSPTKQARDAQPTHCDEVNVFFALLSHDQYVTFMLFSLSSDSKLHTHVARGRDGSNLGRDDLLHLGAPFEGPLSPPFAIFNLPEGT